MTLSQFQELIERIYVEKDRRRGLAGTYMWFAEETGELARALRSGSDAELRAEFADCLAWLTTLASIAGVDLEAASKAQYESGCPKCGGIPCRCPEIPGRGSEQCQGSDSM
ncbi:MAG: nucleotide pyrophosphohydrolase [Armatimonadota bacterium]|nr:MAG: nucleotide pyrophosphohydrolase [Armatimonadota bacterium]